MKYKHTHTAFVEDINKKLAKLLFKPMDAQDFNKKLAKLLFKPMDAQDFNKKLVKLLFKPMDAQELQYSEKYLQFGSKI